jgi:hypothetical protein
MSMTSIDDVCNAVIDLQKKTDPIEKYCQKINAFALFNMKILSFSNSLFITYAKTGDFFF